jgi:hypothetical protein
MDFIERVFHLSPDGGSGLSEVVVLLSVFVILGIYTVRRRSSKRSRRPS